MKPQEMFIRMRNLIFTLIFFSTEIAGDLIGYNRLGNNVYFHMNRSPRQPSTIQQQIRNSATLSPAARAQILRLYSQLQNQDVPKQSKSEIRRPSEYDRRRFMVHRNFALY